MLVTLASCVTPKDDYEDFLARTADARAALMVSPTTDAAPIDAALPETGFGGTYYMACMTPQSGDSVANALSFDVTLQVVPPKDGGGSQVALTTLALVTRATNISQVAPGAVASTATGTVDTMGVGAVVYSVPTTIPGGADPILPGAAIQINTGAAYQLTISSPTQICAGFSGYTSSPIPMTLAPAQNPCVFRIPAADGSLPTLSADDFVWPCP
jgi:hypothetical protein